MRLVAPAGTLRSGGHGVPPGYPVVAGDGRAVTDVSAARPGVTGEWVLLAAAARYATTVSIKRADRRAPQTDRNGEASS
jgi:hypothetical protein